MGGGDLNMKKSWHPLLLTNQQRVWEVEKKAHEEKKKLEQLRKELEEERQLAELQRLQEEATGKKRTEKLDWMYATPSTGDGGALGGQRLGEKDMEDFLLGKKRVDEVLKQGDQNIGAASKDFIAVQNANSAQDLASKIREDPLLAIKQQEQAALQALMTNPAMRKKIKEMKARKEGREGETKEEKKERKRREKEERKLAKKQSKHGHSHSSRRPYTDSEGSRSRTRSRSPVRYDSRRSYHDDRDREYERPRSGRYDERDDRRGGGYDRYRERSRSPRRDEYRDSRAPQDSQRDRDQASNGYHRSGGQRRPSPDYNHRNSGPNGRDRTPPRREPAVNGNHSGPSGRIARPSASDVMDRPLATAAAPALSADEARAARLAQMSADAAHMSTDRLTALERRRKEEEAQFAAEERERQRLKGDTKGAYVREQERLMMGGGADPGVGVGSGLAEALGRRGGRGLQRE